uniref:G-protein coupled receptors family 1 profile domain-containing protein n=1 Tax=Romanomermis culicivorax TaxID=13658 RepID=A0A915IZY8_ROMCU
MAQISSKLKKTAKQQRTIIYGQMAKNLPLADANASADTRKENVPPICGIKIKTLSILLLIAFCLCSKGMVFFELEIVRKMECSGRMSEFEARPSNLMADNFYRNWFSLGFRHFVHIFAPFVLLVWLNWEIVRSMRRNVDKIFNQHDYYYSNNKSSIVRKNLRNFRQASKTMIVLISTYLTGNILNLIVTAMEHIDKKFLNRHPTLYTLSTDVVSLLTMLICLIRLPIYYRFNSTIRSAIKSCFVKRRRFHQCVENFIATEECTHQARHGT